MPVTAWLGWSRQGHPSLCLATSQPGGRLACRPPMTSCIAHTCLGQMAEHRNPHSVPTDTRGHSPGSDFWDERTVVASCCRTSLLSQCHRSRFSSLNILREGTIVPPDCQKSADSRVSRLKSVMPNKCSLSAEDRREARYLGLPHLSLTLSLFFLCYILFFLFF